VVERGLLRAVVADVTVGVLYKLDERRQESDRGDTRTGLGRRETLDVFAQNRGESSVVALAKEVSFADRFIREGSVDGKSGQGNTESREEAGEDANDLAHWEILRASIALNFPPPQWQ
jgi:hypothetical protein